MATEVKGKEGIFIKALFEQKITSAGRTECHLGPPLLQVDLYQQEINKINFFP